MHSPLGRICANIEYMQWLLLRTIYYMNITQNQETLPIILIAKNVNFYVKDGDLHFLRTSNEKE